MGGHISSVINKSGLFLYRRRIGMLRQSGIDVLEKKWREAALDF